MPAPIGARARSQAWSRAPITLGVGVAFALEPVGYRDANGNVYDAPFPGTVVGRFHRGTDFGLSDGTPVAAALAGNVSYAEWSPLGYGNLVTIEGFRYKCRYGHLSEIAVVLGDHVRQGQLLGLSGHSGNATGPHLHFEIYDKVMGCYIDPYRAP